MRALIAGRDGAGMKPQCSRPARNASPARTTASTSSPGLRFQRGRRSRSDGTSTPSSATSASAGLVRTMRPHMARLYHWYVDTGAAPVVDGPMASGLVVDVGAPRSFVVQGRTVTVPVEVRDA